MSIRITCTRLIQAIMLGLALGLPMTLPAQIWDLGADFTTSRNPNGQWSYGYLDNASNVFTAFADTRPWSWAPTDTWSWGNGDGFCGSIGKNTSAIPVIWDGWNTSSRYWYIEPNDVFLQSGSSQHLACCRWTAPDNREIRISAQIWSQSDSTSTTMTLTVLKNGQFLAGKTVRGFIGTSIAGFSDSVGPVPSQSLITVIDVVSGDTLDFVQGQNPFIWKTLGLSLQISPGLTTSCSTIGQLKSANLGDTVTLTTPIPVTICGRFKDNSLFIEAPDRSSATKLIGDEATSITEGNKITFTGMIVADSSQPNGKAIQIGSINSVTSSVCPDALGLNSKTFNYPVPSPYNLWARMYGKITQIVINTGSDNSSWPVEYYVINDGGQDVKVLMHIQKEAMNYLWFTELTVGDYISVSGIPVKNNGQTAIMPRFANDLTRYWNN